MGSSSQKSSRRCLALFAAMVALTLAGATISAHAQDLQRRFTQFPAALGYKIRMD